MSVSDNYQEYSIIIITWLLHSAKMSARSGFTTIKYTNNTKRTDFTVAVYAANLYSSVGELSVAYQVLKTQSTITFEHPKSYAVSATYKQGGQTITSGPIPAEPGNKYEIVKANSSDTAVIREGL